MDTFEVQPPDTSLLGRPGLQPASWVAAPAIDCCDPRRISQVTSRSIIHSRCLSFFSLPPTISTSHSSPLQCPPGHSCGPPRSIPPDPPCGPRGVLYQSSLRLALPLNMKPHLSSFSTPTLSSYHRTSIELPASWHSRKLSTVPKPSTTPSTVGIGYWFLLLPSGPGPSIQIARRYIISEADTCRPRSPPSLLPSPYGPPSR